MIIKKIEPKLLLVFLVAFLLSSCSSSPSGILSNFAGIPVSSNISEKEGALTISVDFPNPVDAQFITQSATRGIEKISVQVFNEHNKEEIAKHDFLNTDLAPRKTTLKKLPTGNVVVRTEAYLAAATTPLKSVDSTVKIQAGKTTPLEVDLGIDLSGSLQVGVNVYYNQAENYVKVGTSEQPAIDTPPLTPQIIGPGKISYSSTIILVGTGSPQDYIQLSVDGRLLNQHVPILDNGYWYIIARGFHEKKTYSIVAHAYKNGIEAKSKPYEVLVTEPSRSFRESFFNNLNNTGVALRDSTGAFLIGSKEVLFDGFILGKYDTPGAISGAVASDFFFVGDIRDTGTQSYNFIFNNDQFDGITFGFAVGGLLADVAQNVPEPGSSVVGVGANAVITPLKTLRKFGHAVTKFSDEANDAINALKAAGKSQDADRLVDFITLVSKNKKTAEKIADLSAKHGDLVTNFAAKLDYLSSEKKIKALEKIHDLGSRISSEKTLRRLNDLVGTSEIHKVDLKKWLSGDNVKNISGFQEILPNASSYRNNYLEVFPAAKKASTVENLEIHHLIPKEWAFVLFTQSRKNIHEVDNLVALPYDFHRKYITPEWNSWRMKFRGKVPSANLIKSQMEKINYMEFDGQRIIDFHKKWSN